MEASQSQGLPSVATGVGGGGVYVVGVLVVWVIANKEKYQAKHLLCSSRLRQQL
jgi:hypothetical protein